MAFPQGIDFRATAAFVIDPTNYTSEITLSTNYPTTTPQGNKVGWETNSLGVNTRDRNSGIDARIAGVAFMTNANQTATYRIDLPATGSYGIQGAFGDDGSYGTGPFTVQLEDTTTVFATPVNNASTAAAGHFYGANGTQETSPANWATNNPDAGSGTDEIMHTFTSTIFRIVVTVGNSGGGANIASIFIRSAGGGGTTYNDTITETGSAADSYAAAATFVASLTESASATDSFSAFLAFAETISESGTASDSYAAVVTFEAPYAEAASAGDDYTAAATFIAAFTEAASATDSLAPNLVIDAVLTEAGSAEDVMDAFVVFAADLAEAGSAADTFDAVATFAAAITEAVNAADAYTASGGSPTTSNIQRITRFARKFNQPLGFE